MIKIENVSKTYSTGVAALRNINLTIQDGEFCFIVGRSGSGKSTLVRLLTKELDPDEGSITVNDTDLGKLRRRHIPGYRRRLGVVFQDFRLLEDRTVYENIGFAQLIIGKTDDEIRENVTRIMHLTGIDAKRNSYPHQLSGGEQQRTAIARALVNRPEILIADEPTGNLDHENASEVMKLLERINEQGTTVIVITHDREMVARMRKRTVRISFGQIVSDEISGDSDYYFDDPLPDDHAQPEPSHESDSESPESPVEDDTQESSGKATSQAATAPSEGPTQDNTSLEWSMDDWIEEAPVRKPSKGLRGNHRRPHKSRKENA